MTPGGGLYYYLPKPRHQNLTTQNLPSKFKIKFSLTGIRIIFRRQIERNSERKKEERMIVKYKQNDVWNYIDNVRQCASKLLSPNELILQYNNEVEAGDMPDVASYTDFNSGEAGATKLPVDIAMTNKVFLMATSSLEEASGNRHCENILDPGMVESHPGYMILLQVDEHKNYDEIILVANDVVYLMNDNGKTIERLA
jgi:hypothetical protein